VEWVLRIRLLSAVQTSAAQKSALTRASNDVLHLWWKSPSSSKYVRRGRKFKKKVCFGLFWVSFRRSSVWPCPQFLNLYDHCGALHPHNSPLAVTLICPFAPPTHVQLYQPTLWFVTGTHVHVYTKLHMYLRMYARTQTGWRQSGNQTTLETRLL
jgi:hypothetical protein